MLPGRVRRRTDSLREVAGAVPAFRPDKAGIAFKPQHFDALLGDAEPPGFVEVHAENYMGDGGRPHAQLRALADRLPLSIHGVGLSIGGPERPDRGHLDRLVRLLERYPVALFSEHLAWCVYGGSFFNDLLPLPYTPEMLRTVCEHVDEVQHALGRRMLIENPSSYFEFDRSSLTEPQFLAEIVARTGCGLLLDLNNVVVSRANNGWSDAAYLATLPMEAVGEIHVAGHKRETVDSGETLLIDDHGSAVGDRVWELYAEVSQYCGPRPTLVEWDTDVPDYPVLREQAHIADRIARAVPRIAPEQSRVA